MKHLKYFSFIFIGLLLTIGCEIENNPVEILSFSVSDSSSVSGETIMLYCVAEDGDNDKISFSWETSEGVFSTERDSTEWLVPEGQGVYLVTCKVSDGVGASDARTISIAVSPRVDVPINGLEWTLIDNGLLNGENSSNENNTGITEYWDGSVDNADYGWNITVQEKPNGSISQALQFKVEDSANCGGDNGNTQSGTATANIQVTGSSPITLELEFSGLGEAQSQGYDLIQFKLDGVLIGDGQAPGGGLGCASDSVLVNPADLQSLDPGAHTLAIDFTTNDAAYHVGAYYEIKLKLTAAR
ncbi:MAG: hypothetical protein ACKVHA_03400 [Fidelibacterota bacterium]|jgi:hypothetical protein|tara:strand:+ start:1295 stop:2194 length:900 start_codon:yes stop_codon:yes gene_type:complete